jgi:hypothetical protein
LEFVGIYVRICARAVGDDRFGDDRNSDDGDSVSDGDYSISSTSPSRLATSSFASKLPQTLHVLLTIDSTNSEFAIGQKLPVKNSTLLNVWLSQAGYQTGSQAYFQAGFRAGLQSPADAHADSQQ